MQTCVFALYLTQTGIAILFMNRKIGFLMCSKNVFLKPFSTRRLEPEIRP